jgi:hypothetical protein
MAEISRPWDGDSGSAGIGDCGPYTSGQWDTLFEHAFLGGRATSEGVIAGVEDELAVNGASSPVSVARGAAWVKGKYYGNTTPVNVVIPTPTVSTRIDRIVLRSDWTAQTVRIYRIEGVEGAGVPARETTDGVLFDLLLYQVSIVITTGVITLTDEREYVRGPLAIIYRRQGGSATNWATTGVNNYKPGPMKIQCGSISWTGAPATSGDIHVNFPVSYTYVPIVIPGIYNMAGGNITVNASITLSDSVHLYWASADGVTTHVSVGLSWLAMGI